MVKCLWNQASKAESTDLHSIPTEFCSGFQAILTPQPRYELLSLLLMLLLLCVHRVTITSSTRTRRGGSCLKDIYKTFLIYRTCMRRAPAKPVRACTLRKWCPASHVTLEAPRHTSHLTVFTLHTAPFAVNTSHFSVHTALSPIHTSHSTLHTSQSTLHTSHFSLLSSHSTLHTSHCTLHAPHFTLHSSHSTLHLI